MDDLHLCPPYSVGDWTWVYNSAATIHQGAKTNTDTTVGKTKLSLNWIGPFNVLTVDQAPASDVLDDRPLYSKLLFLDIPSGLQGRGSNHRASVERFKPCRSPDDTNDKPKYPTKFPSLDVTFDDVSPPTERLEVEIEKWKIKENLSCLPSGDVADT